LKPRLSNDARWPRLRIARFIPAANTNAPIIMIGEFTSGLLVAGCEDMGQV
jgi:hypothetical protein